MGTAAPSGAPISVAALGMYDFPWSEAANDALWAALRDRLRAAGLTGVPELLERARPLEEVWTDSNLFLAQTCGYPLRTRLEGKVKVVATPVYASPFTEGAAHRSAIVIAADAPWQTLADLRGRVAAINGPDSNTGMNLFRAALAPIAGGGPFFSDVLVTGAHLESLAAVAAGRADVAAIDGVTYASVARHRPDLLAGTRVLTATPASPGLPLITRLTAPDEEIAIVRAALASVAADPELASVRWALCLTGFEVLDDNAYDRVLAYERKAAAAGYAVLA